MRDEKVLNSDLSKISELVKESYSFIEVLEKLGLEQKNSIYTRLKRFIYKHKIDYSHFTKTKKESKKRWSKENLENCIKDSKTYKDIIEKLELTPTASSYERLKAYLKEYNLSFKSKYVIKDIWLEENLIPIIKKSYNYKDCLINLKLRAAGNNFKTLRKYINKYNISTEHFKDKQYLRFNKKTLEEILIKDSDTKRSTVKKRLYDEGLKERKCEMCGQGEEWNGKKMSLILDHINGVYNDNRLENLRIVCPNCNATLDTHAGKNIKPNPKTICDCGNKKSPQSVKCKSCNSSGRRKVKRPTKEILLEEIKELGYSGTGRKYGVSDTAIRKWLKNYSIH